MRTVSWVVPDMHCGECAARIRRTLADIDGLRLVRVDVGHQTVQVEGEAPEVFAYAKRQLAAAGYPCASRAASPRN